MCNYTEELEFIKKIIITGYDQYIGKNVKEKISKSEFDLVTSVDIGMENYIISAIHRKYPNDLIHSEELNYSTKIQHRTWTVDPIDGTVNMACNIPLFGIQCSLIEDSKPVVGIIYLPLFNEIYTAQKGGGAFLNGNQILVIPQNLQHSVVSVGDFPHSRIDDAKLEHKIVGNLFSKISKIRMFGAASVDFAYLASGKTSGTIIFTKNKWDIVPGILICQEAGAIIRSLHGDYSFNDNAVIATATEELYHTIINACK